MKHYKTVAGPASLTIDQKGSFTEAVKQYAAIIDREAAGGWELAFIQEIPVVKQTGCIQSLFGKGNESATFNMLIFSRDD